MKTRLTLLLIVFFIGITVSCKKEEKNFDLNNPQTVEIKGVEYSLNVLRTKLATIIGVDSNRLYYDPSNISLRLDTYSEVEYILEDVIDEINKK